MIGSSVVAWFGKRSYSLIETFVKDLHSLRVVWNWVYLSLHVWTSIWLVLFYAEKCGNTVLTINGGLISVIFTGYVVTTYLEKKNGMRTAAKPLELTDDISGSD